MNNQINPITLGMKWFNFFYKFSLPASFIFDVANISLYIENVQYVYLLLTAGHMILCGLTLYTFVKANSSSSLKRPFKLYTLTICLIIYTSVFNFINNPYGGFVWIIWAILNIYYFKKRKIYCFEEDPNSAD